MSLYPSLGPLPIPDSEILALEDLHSQLHHPVVFFDDRDLGSDSPVFWDHPSSHKFLDLFHKTGMKKIYGGRPEIYSGLGTVREGHVTTLRLCHGTFVTLPSSIGNFTHLKQLVVTNSVLKYLPDTLDQLTTLQQLYLKHNKFSDFPEIITHIPSLIELTFSNNYLRTIPPSINRLTNLEGAHFTSNELTQLPDPFGPFPRLWCLSLAQNQLESFPEWVGPYSDHEIHVILSDNKLRTIPATFRNIPHLASLDLDQNSLQSPYDFIVERAHRIKFSLFHQHHIQSVPAKTYYIQRMLGIWEGFPNNLFALLAANRLPSYQFHQVILHSNAGGFVLQKCAEIDTPAAKQYAIMITNEYHRISFGKHNLYGPI